MAICRSPWWLLALAVSSAGCGKDEPIGGTGPGTTPRGYRATIRETSYGIPHVLADDLASASAALGYVGARDYGCVLLDQIVRVKGERSRYFGPGNNNTNHDSDFGMLALEILDRGKRGLEQQSPELRAGIDGYVAGFNRYLETQSLSSECDGQDWVQPLTAGNLFAYYYWLAQLASGDPLFGAIATAAPPGTAQAAQAFDPERLERFAPSDLGSNGWAIGKERSASGRGMLLANPHFPWEGNRRFYESHVTVPGVVNVYGASLLGSSVINIGFNEHVAWTHTVTTARHFTLYRLNLVPGDPTSYLYDGQPRKMGSKEFTIQVKKDDGTLGTEKRTMYRSHYGNMVSIPALGGWSAEVAYSFRNANEDNFAIGEQWLRMNRAKSLADLKQVNRDVQGIPWVNTMAVDAAGNALYMDASRTPNLSKPALDAHAAALASDPITQAVDTNGATLLDGSDPKNEWVDDGAKAPGIVSFARSPIQERTDFVFNANDSYWLTNPIEPLTGYSLLFGKEQTPRTPRTRLNAFMLIERSETGASGADGKFSFQELSQVEFNDRVALAEVLLDQLIARCTGAAPVNAGGVAGSGFDRTVDIATACGVLATWDRRFKLESSGAVLFREFLGSFSAATMNQGALFADVFDPNSPVSTPSKLAAAPATGSDPILVALARAVIMLEKAGLTPASKLKDAQKTRKGDEVIPIHGATNLEGAFNIIGYNSNSGTLLPGLRRGAVLTNAEGTATPTGLTADGYLVNVGSSFMMVMEFTENGPVAEAVLSYSQSTDPASPHYADQTRLFSESKYRKVLFTEADIKADPNLKTTELSIP
jgi:acyl-homoserine-lactone acylase